MSIKGKCTKYLIEAALAVAPIAMLCGAVGVRPQNAELKTVQDIVQDFGKSMGKAQERKSSLEAKLVTPPRNTNVITR